MELFSLREILLRHSLGLFPVFRHAGPVTTSDLF